MPVKPCPCGSGEPRSELRDAAGIFCAFVCSKCEAEKMGRYRPEIFQSGTQYALTGNEEALEIDYGE
jgi:hypothetical protein